MVAVIVAVIVARVMKHPVVREYLMPRKQRKRLWKMRQRRSLVPLEQTPLHV